MTLMSESALSCTSETSSIGRGCPFGQKAQTLMRLSACTQVMTAAKGCACWWSWIQTMRPLVGLIIVFGSVIVVLLQVDAGLVHPAHDFRNAALAPLPRPGLRRRVGLQADGDERDAQGR